MDHFPQRNRSTRSKPYALPIVTLGELFFFAERAKTVAN